MLAVVSLDGNSKEKTVTCTFFSRLLSGVVDIKFMRYHHHVSVNSKCYRLPGNPRVNLQNQANCSNTGKFFCQMHSSQTSREPLF